jgi:tetratricopeptide (TPR) repeat protein
MPRRYADGKAICRSCWSYALQGWRVAARLSRPVACPAASAGTALLLAVFLFAGTALAQTGAPSPPQTQTRLQAEYDELFERMFKNPADLDVTFRFAEVATALGNYEAAISALERMLLFNPNLPRVRLELGVLYFRLGSYDMARSYLTEARNAPDAPPEVKAKVDDFLAEIDRRAAVNRFSGAVIFGGRYQSNANAGPGPAVLQNGQSATLSNQFVRRPDWNIFTTGNVQDSYDLGRQDNAHVETNGTFYYAKQREIGTVDLALVELNTGPRVDLKQGDDLLFNIHPYGITNVVLLNHNLYFWTVGSGLELSRPVTDKLDLDGVFEYRFKRFANSTVIPLATDLDSEAKSFALDARYQLLENGILSLGTSFAKEDARKDYNSFRELDFRGSYTHTIRLPWSLPSGPLVIIPAIYRIYSTYDAADPSIVGSTGTENRVTREWRYVVTGTVGIYENLGATVQFMRSVVWANLPNFKYNNTSVTLGLIYAF